MFLCLSLYSWWRIILCCLSGAQIQRSLVRNNQTQRFSQRQALRLHQGLVTSTAEQVCVYVCTYLHVRMFYVFVPVTLPRLSVSKVMERLCVRVQQQVCILRGVGEMEEIQAAKQVLKEARNSRAVSDVKCMRAHCLHYCCTAIWIHFFSLMLQALPFTVWAGSCAVRGRAGAAEAGLSCWWTCKSCGQGASGRSNSLFSLHDP